MKCSICNKIIDININRAYTINLDVCCEKCHNEIIVPLRNYFKRKNEQCLLVIGDDNSLKQVDFEKEIKLKELQNLVGGNIELYPINDEEYFFIVDEEGILKEKPLNELAYVLTNRVVFGTLVICPKKYFN